MQDREHRPVVGRVEELVGVPAGGERPGLGLPVADHARDGQVGVVERGAERMRECVAELAALVDRSRHFGRDVARDPSRERELLEQPAQTLLVGGHVGIDLAVAALEIGVSDDRRPAVAGPDHIDHVQVAALDHAVEMRVDQVQPRGRAPVAEQPRLDVLERQALAQQRVVEQIDLAYREVVGGAPVCVHSGELGRAQRPLDAGGRRGRLRRRFRGGHGRSPRFRSLRPP